ncbi:UDP-4-amino-4,6-dideoxy-N-acetyl-beta-L-altrosamine transaminase [Carboxylicivirga sp. N1Y90]|uniref:UDP-4-amino-4, 6-dideoxy-N-acetyl-beta-L-altrosamine transaminase n=1 Tax=Carboxylicivirga fragile TaxID=3417571 RepID=UPI003D34D62D|nr:UDP-4-amino-4,6-dideoxy-N-acetyl-beta-L-altrosamine transaminase [Marinilabiliaceae bacterium N1Y90]
MKPISYGKQFISDEDIEQVVQVLKSDFLTQGPKVKEFENDFSDYVDSEYAIAISNGTAALHLCMLALGLKDGDKVITTPLTFAASANCVRYCNAEIDFVDIDAETYLMDLDKLEAKLSKVPIGTYKGIIAVAFAGYPDNMERLRAIADKYKLWLVEDACHAPGGYFVDSKGKVQKVGNGRYADLQVFSFHPVKHIATGEGGMITTNNKNLFTKVSQLRTHGITKDPKLLHENHGGWYYEMQELGYNCRLSDIQAALGVSQLKRAKEGVERRNEIANIYSAAFANENIITPKVNDEYFHAYHLYVIQVEDRKGLYNHLRENNIFSQVLYYPVHLMPYYKELGWNNGDLPVVEAYYGKCLALPMFPTLTNKEQAYIISKVKEFVK